jgi:hypothetical protein
VWKWTWDGTKQNNSSAKQPAKIIFSNNGSPQTDDLVFTNGGYYTKDGCQSVVSGINEIVMDNSLAPTSNRYYNLNGQQVVPNRPGIYIHNGKKYIKR